MKYISEKYLYMMFQHYLESEPVDYWAEVSVYSIPIDVLAIESGDVLTYEFKTKDFKRGLAQANRNLAFSDYSHLIVWNSRVTDALIERVDETPIGLISVGDDIVQESPPQRNNPNHHAKQHAISQVIE